MNEIFGKFGQTLNAMTAKQKLQVGLALIATLGLVWSFTLYANRVRHGVLFSNLAQEDAGSVVAALQARQVDYRLSAGGSMIEVPTGQVDELRLELAGEGLPPGGGVGFEIFDKPAFGLSDFVQNVNYRRALERELGRTIQSLDSVENARVHLALPPESPFADEERRPTASVVVRLRPGRNIANGRVQAITNLVASGVEGLDPANVSVIDADGMMLAGGDSEDGAAGGSQYDARREQEKNIESTLVSLLEPIVGPGRVRARATVELNMTRVEKRQESFDPDVAVIRSQEKKKSKNSGPGGAGGIPGAASNLPPSTAGAGSSGSNAETQETLTNFELNKTVSTISEAVGNLTRQSVAVVVDYSPALAPDPAAEDPAAQQQPQPRSPEEMRQITEIVRAAIGFNADRGDVLNVENIPFDRGTEPEPIGFDVTGTLTKVLRFGSLPLAVLLLALFVIRPGITVLKGIATPGSSAGNSPPTIGELQARAQAQLGPGGAAALQAGGGSTLREKLIEAINADPETAALVVRNWMTVDGDSKR